MSATQDVRYQHSLMKIGDNESIEDFAQRLYSIQMEVYSSWAGRDLDTPFIFLSQADREDWYRTARSHPSVKARINNSKKKST